MVGIKFLQVWNINRSISVESLQPIIAAKKIQISVINFVKK